MTTAGPARPAPAVTVSVRFWAGARRAAGHAQEELSGVVVGDVLDVLRSRPALVQVLAAASFLLDGQRADAATPLTAGSTVDVLPPFAGG